MTNKEKIIDFLMKTPHKTNKEISEGTDLDVKNLRFTLYRMKGEGLIEKDKNGLWVIDKKNQELKEEDKQILDDTLRICYEELMSATVTREKIKLAEIIVKIIFSGKRG